MYGRKRRKQGTAARHPRRTATHIRYAAALHFLTPWKATDAAPVRPMHTATLRRKNASEKPNEPIHLQQHPMDPRQQAVLSPIHGVLSLIQGLFWVPFRPLFATPAWHLRAKIALFKQITGCFGCCFQAFANKRAKEGGQPWRKKEGKPPMRSRKRLKKLNTPVYIFSPQGVKNSRAALFRTPRPVAFFWKSKRTDPAPPSGKADKPPIGCPPFRHLCCANAEAARAKQEKARLSPPLLRQDRMRLGKAKEKRAFPWLCTRLSLSLASPKINAARTKQEKASFLLLRHSPFAIFGFAQD